MLCPTSFSGFGPQAAVSSRSKPTLYSIISSARASSISGTSRPNALEVSALIRKAKFVRRLRKLSRPTLSHCRFKNPSTSRLKSAGLSW
jgi:hypothetical protein